MSNKKRIEMIEDWNDSEYCLVAVKEDGYALGFVKNQTHEICLEAVKQNGFALGFVINQTPDICLEAVKSDGYSLQFVKEQTPEICLEAVKQKGRAFRFVKNQTPLIIHYLKKYNITIYNSHKKKNLITISDKEMVEFYNDNPHLLLTL